MADPKDKTSPETPSKPAGRSSAVKPPVLEGTARPVGAKAAAETTKSTDESIKDAMLKTEPATAEATKPDPAKAGPVKPETPKPEPAKFGPVKPEATKPAEMPPKATSTPPLAAKPASTSAQGSPWLAGLVGGVVGLGVAYGLALAGLWPSTAPAPVPQVEDPRVASIASSVPELETITSTLQSELATLTARVAGLETDAPVAAGDPAQTDQLAGDIAALSARLDELAAAPREADDTSAANAAAIASLEAEIAQLRQASAEAQANLGAVTSQVAAIEADVTAGTAAEAGQARLPLIVSGFETAFATGASYDAEVAALRQALPDLSIPEAVLANAMTGLKRQDLIARDFNAALPDILAGRPVNAGAGWQEATSDWFRGIIALRPTEAVEGDGPEAVVARLEGAIGRGDFVAAKAELDALPPAMRDAAGAVVSDIENQAAAQGFLLSLRQAALVGGNGA